MSKNSNSMTKNLKEFQNSITKLELSPSPIYSSNTSSNLVIMVFLKFKNSE